MRLERSEVRVDSAKGFYHVILLGPWESTEAQSSTENEGYIVNGEDTVALIVAQHRVSIGEGKH